MLAVLGERAAGALVGRPYCVDYGIVGIRGGYWFKTWYSRIE